MLRSRGMKTSLVVLVLLVSGTTFAFSGSAANGPRQDDWTVAIYIASANNLAITVLAARAEPRLMTKVEAETAGRWDMQISGLARWEMREKASISTMRPVRKSMRKTTIMVETVSSSVCRSRSSIVKSFNSNTPDGIL